MTGAETTCRRGRWRSSGRRCWRCRWRTATAASHLSLNCTTRCVRRVDAGATPLGSIWSPLKSTGRVGSMASPCCGTGFVPVVGVDAAGPVGGGRQVHEVQACRSCPTSLRISSGSAAPGTSTMTLSAPWICTSGSETPVELTRFSMIVWIVVMSPGPGAAPLVVTAWYSTEMPPCRSRPSRVAIVPRRRWCPGVTGWARNRWRARPGRRPR